MNYVEKAWEDYVKAVYHNRTISEMQRTECKRAFFAGAMGLFSTLATFLEPGAEPTENDMRRIELLSEELEDFLRSVKEERA